jgi:hypothetical protein
VLRNLDLVKSIFAEWERGDWSSADWANPEIEFEMIGGLSEGRWTGVSEMAKAWAAMLGAWEDRSDGVRRHLNPSGGRGNVLGPCPEA